MPCTGDRSVMHQRSKCHALVIEVMPRAGDKITLHLTQLTKRIHNNEKFTPFTPVHNYSKNYLWWYVMKPLLAAGKYGLTVQRRHKHYHSNYSYCPSVLQLWSSALASPQKFGSDQNLVQGEFLYTLNHPKFLYAPNNQKFGQRRIFCIYALNNPKLPGKIDLVQLLVQSNLRWTSKICTSWTDSTLQKLIQYHLYIPIYSEL